MSRLPGFTAGASLSRSFPATWRGQADPQRIEPQGCNNCFEVDSGWVYGTNPNTTLEQAHKAAFVMIPFKAAAFGVTDPANHCLAEHLGSGCEQDPNRKGYYRCKSHGRACYES